MQVDDARCRILSLTVLMVILSSLVWAANRAEAISEAAVETSKFGTLDDGKVVELYTLKNAKGATAKIITYGATLTELWVPDRSGKLGDVVSGSTTFRATSGNIPGSEPRSDA